LWGDKREEKSKGKGPRRTGTVGEKNLLHSTDLRGKRMGPAGVEGDIHRGRSRGGGLYASRGIQTADIRGEKGIGKRSFN